MSFFDQLQDNFKNVTKDLNKKTQDVVEKGKLNSKISAANDLIRNTYAAIGEAFYAMHAQDEDCEFAEQFQIIAETLASVEEYKNELMKLKGVKACPICGAEIQSDAQFCPKCGQKIAVPEPVQEEAAAENKICPVCGAEMPSDAQFCTSCGASLQDKAE